MLHHCSWAYEKFSNYIGCESIVQQALDILFPSTNHDVTNTGNERLIDRNAAKPLPLSGIKLYIVGKSGMVHNST